MKYCTPVILAVSAGCLVAGCESPADTDTVAELQTEVEQLENQIGRLEFRVYELENSLNRQTAEETATTGADETATTPPADAGRYDLTPVE